jgi:hypothetical protein
VLDSVLGPIVGVELSKKVFISRVRWISLIVELNASTNMFYPLKNLLLLNLVIFKLKCNNLIVNEIMVLNASYVCLLHRRFIENHPIWILEHGPLISEGVLPHTLYFQLTHMRTSAPSVDYHICFSRVVVYSNIIILNKLQSYSWPKATIPRHHHCRE